MTFYSSHGGIRFYLSPWYRVYTNAMFISKGSYGYRESNVDSDIKFSPPMEGKFYVGNTKFPLPN